MDYGSATGWEALSPPAPTDAPDHDGEPRQGASRPRASAAVRDSEGNRALAQSQHAGIAAMLGLAGAPAAAPSRRVPAHRAPASAGAGTSVASQNLTRAALAAPELARTATMLAPPPPVPSSLAPSSPAAPSPAPPSAGHQAVLLRPTAHARPRELVAEQPAAPRDGQDAGADRRFSHLPGLSLMVVILSVQAALSALFLRANTAFGDEALYLWAGHLEWAHWLHGTRIPAFATWFSGSPAVYPPIGALADSLGGLAAARALSLCFMLGTTCLLWGTTARLFGRQAAFFAAGLFAVLGPTLHLGAFATYDAMALFLLAFAAWSACAARTREDATGWMMACAGALALANATKYASALFDPVVILLAVLSACPRPGGKVALRRAALLITCLAGALAVLLRLGGSWYIVGISETTTQRPVGQDPISKVLSESWQWTAVVVGAALVAVILSLIKRNSRSVTWLIAVLAAAALLVPAEQARIQTTVSLGKHVDFGAWFACIAGGYALAALAALPRPSLARKIAAACLGLGLLPVAASGLLQAKALVNWPGSAQLVRFLRPLTSHGGHFLAETDDVPEYYLPGTSWRQWSNTFSITRPNGDVVFVHGATAAYAQEISRHYFSLVILSFSETPSMDTQLTTVLRRTPGYKVIKYVPYTGPVRGAYTIWAYQPAPTPAQPGTTAARPGTRAARPGTRATRPGTRATRPGAKAGRP